MKLSFKKRGRVLIGIIVFTVLLYTLFSTSTEYEIFEIKSGMNARHVADIIYQKDIIRFPRLFLLIFRLTGDAGEIQAGSYKIPVDINYIALINKLTSGPNVFTKITIPEGYTTEQIAKQLKDKKIIKDKEYFVKWVEEKDLRGFLFPETYMFSENTPVTEILTVMVEQFNNSFSIALASKSDSEKRLEQLGYTKKEIVALASLIEKEARVPEERPIISATFHKRLEKNMYLESCASILFALGEHRSRLIYRDLEVDSPYNTYRNSGLPPTPICNPGLESIKAALYPADTEYMFFFTRGDGSHIFSKTYEEHLERQRKFSTIIDR